MHAHVQATADAPRVLSTSVRPFVAARQGRIIKLWLWAVAVASSPGARERGGDGGRVRPSAVRLHRTMPAHARRYVVYANAGLQEG